MLPYCKFGTLDTLGYHVLSEQAKEYTQKIIKNLHENS